jgi:hypothetical protein
MYRFLTLRQAVQVTKTGICTVDNLSVPCSIYNVIRYELLRDEVCACCLVAPGVILNRVIPVVYVPVGIREIRQTQLKYVLYIIIYFY